MQEEKYLQEIRSLIENSEASKIVREFKNNYEDLLTKWNIGKLLLEAQGGEKRAKYGNKLINEWSKEFSLNYGNGYSARNLRKMRQFYQTFSNLAASGGQIKLVTNCGTSTNTK